MLALLGFAVKAEWGSIERIFKLRTAGNEEETKVNLTFIITVLHFELPALCMCVSIPICSSTTVEYTEVHEIQ